MNPLDRFLAAVRQPWRAEAVCRDLPEEEQKRAFAGRWTQQAFKADYCASCPVVGDCLDDAMAFWDEQGVNPSGVWGHTTAPERVRLRAVWLADHAEPNELGESA